MEKETDANLKKETRTFYHPCFRSRSSKQLDLLRVVTEETYTRLDLIYYKPQKQLLNTISIQLDPETYLLPQHGDIKLKLLKVENIPLAPKVYKMVKGIPTASFSLYFEPLIKTCFIFSLIEKPVVRGNLFNIYKINLLSQKTFASILKN